MYPKYYTKIRPGKHHIRVVTSIFYIIALYVQYSFFPPINISFCITDEYLYIFRFYDWMCQAHNNNNNKKGFDLYVY